MRPGPRKGRMPHFSKDPRHWFKKIASAKFAREIFVDRPTYRLKSQIDMNPTKTFKKYGWNKRIRTRDTKKSKALLGCALPLTPNFTYNSLPQYLGKLEQSHSHLKMLLHIHLPFQLQWSAELK
jgi:hypothetical protein